MILYGFMVRYGENNRGGLGGPPPVVFRQNERPWLLGLSTDGQTDGSTDGQTLKDQKKGVDVKN